MKNKKLLKVLVGGVLVSTLGAGGVLNNNFTKTNNTVYATDAPKDTELDIKNLQDGIYSLDVHMLHFYNKSQFSMSEGAVEHNAKLVVNNGEYRVYLTFKPLQRELMGKNFTGYLGNLKYSTAKTKDEVNDFIDTTIEEFYPESAKDDFVDVYIKKYPDRKAYPKVLSYPINKDLIKENKKLETYAEVFVPVMESIMTGVGTQRVMPTFDFNTLKLVKLTKKEEPKVEDALSKDVVKDVNGYVTLVDKKGDERVSVTIAKKENITEFNAVALDKEKKDELKTLIMNKAKEANATKVQKDFVKLTQSKNATVEIYDLYFTKDGNKVESSEERTVRIAVLDADKKDYKVYHIKDNGEVELIPSKVKDGYVEFQVNHFSTFAIIGTEKVEMKDGIKVLPKTGVATSSPILLLSTLLGSAYLLIRRR